MKTEHNPTKAKKADSDSDKDSDSEPDSESIKIHFAEFVSMTNVEYQRLVDTHGKEFADQCIKTLDNYKGSIGKKYKSDYRAILSWVIDSVKEKQGEKTQKTISPSNSYHAENQYSNLDGFYMN